MDLNKKKLINMIGTLPLKHKSLISKGISRHMIHILLSKNIIKRVKRGIYQVTKKDFYSEDIYREVSTIVGSKSAICLLSALEYYNFTDHITKKTWIMVPYNKRTSVNNIKVFRSRNPHWNIGIKQNKI